MKILYNYTTSHDLTNLFFIYMIVPVINKIYIIENNMIMNPLSVCVLKMYFLI